MEKKAVVLLSGGLDSVTCLAIAKEKGFACYAISFSYGQKHNIELERAQEIARTQQVREHKIIDVAGIGAIGGSALTDETIAVKDFEEGNDAIPQTYVPARNTIFLSIALGWAEVLGAFDIFIGANVIDYSKYPDCRPEYIKAFEDMANLATKASVEGMHFTIQTPIIQMNKAEIIAEGLRLGVDYSRTISCYRANDKGEACGTCDSCVYRKRGFAKAGVEDPTLYI